MESDRLSLMELRLKDDPMGLRLLRATDGLRVVKIIYDHNNQISDCDIAKGKEEVQNFKWEFKAGLSTATAKNITVARNTAQVYHFGKLRGDCLTFHDSKKSVKEDEKRAKRSILIFPGTKWCGKGNEAKFVSDLGSAAGPDKCCLEHDGCPYIIQGLTTNFHYFNYRLHTLSYCDCDRRFQQCLKEANSGAANLIGKVYFNVVNSQCFELKRERICAQRSWWGSCRKWRFRPVANVVETGEWS